LDLARKKLYDVESAVLAGKTTASSLTGLKASVADEEQTILKIKFQIDDYSADLKRLSGLPPSSSFILEPVALDDFEFTSLTVNELADKAKNHNNDLKIAELTLQKAEHAIAASRYSYLPDLGVLGGYSYQKGSMQLPPDTYNVDFAPKWEMQNTFVGVALRWNMQDIFSNTYIKRQRVALRKQAEQNLANTLEQVNADIEKAERKTSQAAELISVARKVVDFRREDFKIQTDRLRAGLNLEADYLSAKAALAKAESDLFAAQLNYRIAVTDVQILTGKF
jgi:outer membrane protein